MKTVDVEAEKREIDRLTDEAFVAEDRKDLEKMLEGLADDAILQVPNMPQIQGIKALREFYKAFLPTFDSMKGGPRHIEVSASDTACPPIRTLPAVRLIGAQTPESNSSQSAK